MKSLRINYIFLYCIAFIILLVLSVSQASAETYQYDPVGRLTKVAYDDGYTISYSYDNAGNLLQRVVTVTMTLADAIRVLQVLAQSDSSAPVYKKMDVDGDGQIGLGEVIYILQKVSELRH